MSSNITLVALRVYCNYCHREENQYVSDGLKDCEREKLNKLVELRANKVFESDDVYKDLRVIAEIRLKKLLEYRRKTTRFAPIHNNMYHMLQDGDDIFSETHHRNFLNTEYGKLNVNERIERDFFHWRYIKHRAQHMIGEEYMVCDFNMSNYIVSKSDVNRFNQVYFYPTIIEARKPFTLFEKGVLNALKIIDRLGPLELLPLYRTLQTRNCYVRVGDDFGRKVFDALSIVEQYIFLGLGVPLAKPTYFDNLKKNMRLFCPHCPSIVNVSCPCSLCVYYRELCLPHYSVLSETDGHHAECTVQPI